MGHAAGRKRSCGSYVVFARRRPDPSADESLLPDFAQRAGRKKAADSWSVWIRFRPVAMIRAGGALFVGGESDTRVPPAKSLSRDQDSGGTLLVVSAATGKTLAKLPLDAPPVWDGMAAAKGRLFMSTRDGAVVCLGDDGIAGSRAKTDVLD